jgi:adenylate cyclase class 2
MATLDETPIGVFLELEGPAEWIDRVAEELGFDESDYILASYATLYADHCRQRGVKPTDMLFSTERGSGDPSNP